MTKLSLIDAIGDLDMTCGKVKCLVDELANKHFSTDDISRNINLTIYNFPHHQTMFMIMYDYTEQLQRQICELQVELSEGGIEI